MSKKKTHEQFLEELKDKNKNFENIDFLSKYNGVKNRIKCKCKQCGTEWETTPDALKMGTGCPKCAKNKIRIASTRTIESFLFELYQKRDDVEYVSGYVNTKKKAAFKCKKHNLIFENTPERILKGAMCPLCRKEKPQYNKLTKEEINKRIFHLKVEMIGEYINSKTPTSFKCKICGNTFTSKYELVKEWKIAGCEKCSNKTNSKNWEDKINNRINKLNLKKSKYVKIVSYDENCEKIKCQCLLCREIYETSYYSLVNGCMHKVCASIISQSHLRFTKEEVIERTKMFGNKIHIDFSNYLSSDSLLDCKCEICGHKWKAKQKNLVRGRGCPVCAQKKRDQSKYKPLDYYKELLDEMNLIVVSDYVNATTPVTLKCKVCGNEFESTLTYISNTSIGCKICSQEKYRVQKLNDFTEILFSKNPTIKIIGDYIDMSTPTAFLCSKCNKIFERTPHDLLKSCTCPNCTTNSKLEYFIKLYLDINGIYYKLHHTFDGLYGVNGGLLSYDFYLPEYEFLIEAQGQQHYMAIDFFGGEESFKIQQEHDKRKRKYAENKNIKLFEISYNDINNIKNILDEIFKIDIKKAS